ncbi:hypothetical protein [uncultured Gammaproteobacteria bacterium]|nr:hypothetical protein [uncultured Gammaproteobacteria bacterium]CAC9457251.1 hypothetical protein [uncultured Gammaproteobacteria bacterium]
MKIDPIRDLIDKNLLEELHAGSLYQEIINSQTFERLKDIRFLGAIDYLYKKNKHKTHSRYTHTLSVATLALKYSQLSKLKFNDEKYLVCAALLHDIGHAPLSHSMEPAFKKRFGISHHSASNSIIQGTSPLGKEIASILKKYQIDIGKLIGLLDNKSQEKYAVALSGSINVDTIDGIIRTHSYLRNEEKYSNIPKAVHIVEELFGKPKRYGAIDKFWGLKDGIYRDIINKKINIYADNVTQKHVLSNQNVFVDEFYWTEVKFKEKYTFLFEELSAIRLKNIPAEALNYNKRSYTIDGRYSDIGKKYLHEKTPSVFSFNQPGLC